MKKMMQRDDLVAIAIDYQTKLVPAMQEGEEVEAVAAKLIQGLRVLEVPVLVTQQYTKGLGETTAPVAQALGEFSPFEKTTFSALKAEGFMEALQKTGAKSVLVFGIEAHVCLQQTVLELLEAGYDVFVAADACSSRKQKDAEMAYRRMIHAGAVLTTYEAVLFELMDGSKSAGFKEISAIVK